MRRRAAPPWCAFLLLVASDLATRGDVSEAWPNVDPELVPVLRPALERTVSRLEDPECVRVFGDFVDSRTGRPLLDTLTEMGTSPARHLRGISFLDGSRRPLCFSDGTLALTSPGSPVVFVCRAQFQRTQLKDRGFASTVLIHEALHTLGLSEDPPVSAEISLRVQARCGR